MIQLSVFLQSGKSWQGTECCGENKKQANLCQNYRKSQDLEVSGATLKNMCIRLGLKTEGMAKSIYNEQLGQQSFSQRSGRQTEAHEPHADGSFACAVFFLF